MALWAVLLGPSVAAGQADGWPLTGVRLEDACRAMEARAAAKEPKDLEEAAKLEEAFEKAFGFRAKEEKWAERVAAYRQWWEARRKSTVDADVPRAIDAGVAWLRKRQEKDGTWKYCACGDAETKALDYPAGTTALAVYTLLKCGVPPGDKAVRDGVDVFLRVPVNKVPAAQTYTVGMMALALSEVVVLHKAAWKDRRATPAEKVLQGQALQRLNECAHWLERARLQTRRDGVELGRWHYDKVSEAWDSSTTQVALLGLLACRNAGAPVPAEAWKTAENHWRATQFQDGGWPYMIDKAAPDKFPATPSMTSAGIASILICKAAPQGTDTRKAGENEKAVDSARAWLAKRYPVAGPVRHSMGHMGHLFYSYCLYALQRAMMLAGWDDLGGRSWYHDGALGILVMQQADGSWKDVPDTCFYLLFLKRAYTTVLSPERGGGR